MKKIYFLILNLLFISIAVAQTKGITYQAVIYDPESLNSILPGINNQPVPFANKSICLRFEITDVNLKKVYVETQSTTTDEFGMVNLIIGKGTFISGTVTSFEQIIWDASINGLIVSIDNSSNCSKFVQVSNQPFTATPYSMGTTSIDTSNLEIKTNKSTNVIIDAISDTKYPTVKAVKSYVDNQVNSAISNAQTVLDSKANIADLNTKENTANKSTDGTFATNSNVKFPTEKAVKTYVDTQVISAISNAQTVIDTKANITDLNTKENTANKSTDGTFTTNSDVKFPTEKAVKTYVNAQVTSAISNAQTVIDTKANITDLNTKENTANKSTDGTFTTNSDVKFPTEKAVKTYVDSMTSIDASPVRKGKISLSGDLSGTADSPKVVKIQGSPIDNATPSINQFLIFDGASWKPTTFNQTTDKQIANYSVNAPIRDFTLTKLPYTKPVLYINGVRIDGDAITIDLTLNRLIYDSSKNDNYTINSGDVIEIEYLSN